MNTGCWEVEYFVLKIKIEGFFLKFIHYLLDVLTSLYLIFKFILLFLVSIEYVSI